VAGALQPAEHRHLPIIEMVIGILDRFKLTPTN
jgi:hypothetical protein